MSSVIDLVLHYQRSIEKSVDDKKRVLRCLDKLHQLGVTVQHLQETGVGRTVNALRKEAGEVGDAARALVNKWKNMVAEEADSSDSDEEPAPPDHRGRDSPEESDHKSVNQSRHGGQAYQSYPETDNHYNKPQNGDYDKPHKRHHDSEDEHDRSKRSKLQNGEVSDEDDVPHKSNVSPIRIKTEHSNSYEDEHENENEDEHGDDDDQFASENDTSDERSHNLTKVKDEVLSGDDADDYNKPKKYSMSELTVKSKNREEDSRSESSQTSEGKSKSDSKNKSEKSSDKLRHMEKEFRRERKDSKHSSHKSSTSEKDKRSEKTDSSSDRHRSSDKHRSSEKQKSSDKHKSSENDKSSSAKLYSSEKSSEKSDSKDKHKSSSEKHKSSNHKEKSRDDENRPSRLEKSKSSDISSSRKEKTKDGKSASSHKERSSESSSSHKEKHLKSSSSKEKSRSSESSSKSKHSEQSSHSHKNQDEKKSRSSDNRHNSIDKALVEEEKKKDHNSNSKADTKQQGSSPRTSKCTNKDEVSKKKSRVRSESVNSDDGIGCESGASFAEALGMVSPVKAKKKSQGKEVSISSPSNGPASTSTSNGFPVPASLLAPSTKLAPLPPLEISALPEISPHYKPRPPPRLLPHTNEEQALSYVMSNKNQRTKVFSGNKTYGKLSSLYDLCVAVLQEHIDALEYTGGVPYEILKPVVDRATPDQLFVLEHYNPYLMEDTDHLWRRHCELKFRNKQRHEMETWREMYSRCLDEQEARLKSLTANIKMAQEVRNAPTKQTKMAYVDSVVKPPRNIARKQAIHGTARAAVTSPAARVASLAGAGVVRAGTLPPRAVAAHAPSASAPAAFKPKKAPLMQKALQFMRGRKR